MVDEAEKAGIEKRPVRQFIEVYECDSCTYQASSPNRNKHHFPRDKPRRLPGQPPEQKCPGTLLKVTYMRYVATPYSPTQTGADS